MAPSKATESEMLTLGTHSTSFIHCDDDSGAELWIKYRAGVQKNYTNYNRDIMTTYLRIIIGRKRSL